MTSQKMMTLTEYFSELRNRILICLVFFICSFALCYFYAETIYQFLLHPLEILYQGRDKKLIYTGLTEAFFTYIKLSFFAAFFLSFPILAWQFYRFLAPGLYLNEKRGLYPFLIMAPILFFIGSFIAYYIIFPLAWKFFIAFETYGVSGGLPILLEARISEYLSLSMHIIIAFGIAFQLPIVILLLVKSGVVTKEFLRKKRKYMLVGIVTLAAIITPPDIISQIGLAIPIYLLFELSILMCGRK